MPTRYYGVQNEVKAYCNRLQNETSIVVTPSVLKTLNDRVESLKRSGVWSQFGLGFNDNDGDAYLSRASVSDVIGRAEVLWFTRGIKSLGLWNSMVSWPLRSYQNVGSGSTVYGLGGFGVSNGTLENSPTWGTSGISFITASQRMRATNVFQNIATPNLLAGWLGLLNPQASNVSCFIGSGNPDSVNQWSIDSFDSASRLRWHVSPSGRTDGSCNVSIAQTALQRSAIRFSQMYLAPTTNTGSFIRTGDNSIQTVSASFTEAIMTNSNPNIMMGDNLNYPGQTFNGISSFGYVCSKVANTSEIYSLYKQTLGNGLGLP